jgi:hypothetical protein
MATTATGSGYWLVASDGGIFTFGRAGSYGSTGGQALKSPIVGMAVSLDGLGYGLVSSNGEVTPFGDFVSYGSTANQVLASPIHAISD